MTTSDDDIDDFDFDDDFAEEWGDDPADLQFSEDEINEVTDASTLDDYSEKKTPKKVSGPKRSSLGIVAPLSVVVFLAAGGYFGYTYFAPSSPSVPIVNIPGDNSNLSSIDNSRVTEEQTVTSNESADDIVVEETSIVDSVVNEAPLASDFSDETDDVLTPLPDNFEEIDISLASLSEENSNVGDDQDISNTENSSTSENEFTNESNENDLFDEQEMLQKTESLPSDETSVNQDDDIFDRIDNITTTQTDDADVIVDDKDIIADVAFEADDSQSGNQTAIENTQNISSPQEQNNSNDEIFIEKVAKENTSISKSKEPKAIHTSENIKDAPPVPAYSKPDPVKRVKANWKIKAIQPGKAVIRDTISGAVKSVEIGGFVDEIGKITDITKKNGKWTVIGKTGEITQ